MLAPPPPLPTSSAGISATPAVPSSIPPPSTHVPRPVLNCNNCKERGLRSTGHTDGTCFQPGGGMEGRREEYMSNKGRFHAMFVECLDNAAFICDTVVPSSISPLPSPYSPPVLDDEIVLPPIV